MPSDSIFEAEQDTARGWLLETTRLRPFVFYLCRKASAWNSLNFFTCASFLWVNFMSIVAVMLLTDVIHLDGDNRGWISLTASAVTVFFLGLSAVTIVTYWEWHARISHRQLLAVAKPTIISVYVLFMAFLAAAIINTKYGGHAGDGDDDDDLKFDDDDYWTDDKNRGKMAEAIALGILALAAPFAVGSFVDAVTAHVMPECKTSPIDFRNRVESGREMAGPGKSRKRKGGRPRHV